MPYHRAVLDKQSEVYCSCFARTLSIHSSNSRVRKEADTLTGSTICDEQSTFDGQPVGCLLLFANRKRGRQQIRFFESLGHIACRRGSSV